MRTNCFILSLILNLPFILSGQDWQKIPEGIRNKDMVDMDNIGNFYALQRSDNSLHKYDINAEKTYSFNKPGYGIPHTIDVSNSLQLMLYYKSSNTLILLNRVLSPLGNEIELEDIGHYNENLVCLSKRGGFWVYDPILNRVFYYDKTLSNKHKSPIITSLIQVSMGSPTHLREIDNYLFLYFPQKGILVFDLLGNFYKSIFHEGGDYLSYHQGMLYIGDNQMITRYDLLTLESTLIEVDGTEDSHPIIRQNKLFLFKDKHYQTITLN